MNTQLRPGVIRPSAVPAGGRIAIISPSGPAAAQFPARLRRGLNVLRSAGFDVAEGQSMQADTGLTAGTISERLDDLHWAFSDPSVHAILCTIGGQLSSQLLPDIDFGLIAANPKFFCGYSDTTSLHCAIGTATGLTTFYGTAVMPELGELPAPAAETLRTFLSALRTPYHTQSLPDVPAEVTEHVDWAQDRPRRTHPAPTLTVVRDGQARGPLIAACLPVLAHLSGTPYIPDLSGTVLLLDTPQGPYSLADAASDLWQLRIAGLLDHVAAIAFGRPHTTTDMAGLPAIVRQITSPATPVILGLPIGHTYPNLTVPIGANAQLDSAGLHILDGGVQPAG